MEHSSTSSPSRRALCVGLSRFGVHEEEPLAGSYSELPYARKRARAVAEALASLGYASETFGEEQLGTAEALGEAVMSAINAGRNGDIQVVHVLSHGYRARSSVYVIGADGDYTNSTSVAGWTAYVEDSPHRQRPHTLFLVDTCYAGAAARLDWLRAARPDARAWVIAATLDDSPAYEGRFSQAVATVLTRIHTGDIDFYPSEYIPFGHVVEHIRREVIQRGGEGQYVCSTPVDGNPAPPFFPNQRRPVGTGPVGSWEGIDAAAQPFADLDAGLDEAHFLDRATGHRGLGARVAIGCFTGREPELQALAAWLHDSSSGGLRLVIGGPGSGKSALLGILVCAAHPQLHERTRPIWEHVDGLANCRTDDLVAVHLRERDLSETLSSLIRQLRLPVHAAKRTAAEVITAIKTLSNPPTIVADALDEAVGQAELVQDLLLPLAGAIRTDGAPACRLLVGMRPWEQFAALQDLARQTGGLIDLDVVPVARLQGELSDYVQDLLSLAPGYSQRRDRPVRKAIAEHVADALTKPGQERGGEFLAAALFVNWLVTQHPHGVTIAEAKEFTGYIPCNVREILELDLTAHISQPWFRAVLVTLAHARGAGMPATVIRRLAPLCRSQDGGNTIGDATLSVPEFDQILREVRFYLRSSADTDGTTLYRLFHQGLVDHLRSEDIDLSSLVVGLLATVPVGPDSRRKWDAAEPYVRRHALQHAVDAGRLDELIYADLDESESMVNSATTAVGRVSIAVYSESTNTDGSDDISVRRDLMVMNAVRYGFPELASRLAHVSKLPEHHWWPEWATGGQLPPIPLFVLGSPIGEIRAVACGDADGRHLVMAGGIDCRFRMWDMSTGQSVDNPTIDPDAMTRAVACTKLDGRVVTVTGGKDGTVRVWDLTTGALVGNPIAGHTSEVYTVACTELNGRAVAVTTGGDGTMRIWDLANAEPICDPMIDQRYEVYAAACTKLNGRAVAVTGGADGTVQVWDLATGAPIGNPIAEKTDASIGDPIAKKKGSVYAVACTELSGRPVAVTGGADGAVRVWDLAGHIFIGLLTGHNGDVHAVACTELNGRAVAVTGGADGTVRVWDLATGAPVGNPIAGHIGKVHAVACTELNGRTVAVTGGADGKARVWDLANRRFTGDPLIGHSATVRAVAYATVGGYPVAVTGSDDQTVRVWELSRGQPIGDPMTRHGGVTALACAVIGSHTIAVTAGNGTLLMFDVTPRRKRMTGRGLVSTGINGVACGTLDRRSIAVTVGHDQDLQIWDLAVRKCIGTLSLRYFASKVTSVACAMLGSDLVVVTVSDDRKARVWDLAFGVPIGEPMTGQIHAVACSMLNGCPIAVTVGGDQNVRVWDLASGMPIGEPMTGHTSPIHAVACGKVNGRSVAVTGGEDSVVRVWDLASGTQCEAFVLPGAINDLSVTADGDLLVAFGWEVAYLKSVRRMAADT